VPAGVGGDRETGRHREAEARHLGEVRALPAEQIHLLPAARREVEHQPGRVGTMDSSWSWTPDRASVVVIAAPMPRALPVTIATRSSGWVSVGAVKVRPLLDRC
jgi:hypothetical protein